MSQIALPFDWPEAEAAASFLVTEANRLAVRHLEAPGRWAVRASVLTGPRKSGRSLLARIFAAQSNGSIIDDAECLAETEIFHRWNEAQDDRRPLLIVTLETAPAWKPRLPDLASRLAVTPVARINPPDDALFDLLLTKFLAQRGLMLPADVAHWLRLRAERSYVTIMRLADALDTLALAKRRRITIPLARDVLASMGMLQEEDLVSDRAD